MRLRKDERKRLRVDVLERMKKTTKQDGFYLEGYATGRKGIIHGGTVGPDAGLRAYLSVRIGGKATVVATVACCESEGHLWITVLPAKTVCKVGKLMPLDGTGFMIDAETTRKDGDE